MVCCLHTFCRYVYRIWTLKEVPPSLWRKFKSLRCSNHDDVIIDLLNFSCTLKELCRIKKKFFDILYQSIKIPIYNLKSILRGDKELVWCRFWEIVGILDMFHLSKMRFFLLFFSFIFCRKQEFNRWFSLCLTESHLINQRYYYYDASISLKEFITCIS